MRPVDDDLVGVREPGRGGEHGTRVADRHLVAQVGAEAGHRGGEVDGAEHQHPGRRLERVDEHGHAFAGDGPPSCSRSSPARWRRPTRCSAIPRRSSACSRPAAPASSGGARNCCRDMRHNGGMPAPVDRAALHGRREPGRHARRRRVPRRGLRGHPVRAVDAPGARAPVLMVAAADQQVLLHGPGARAQLHRARGRPQGLQFFVISWRNPGAEQRDWDLDTYADAVLRVIDVAREITRSDDVNLLSLCAGGISPRTVLNHLAADGDERVQVGQLRRDAARLRRPGADRHVRRAAAAVAGARRSLARAGVLDGRALGAVFTWLRPNDLVWNYWVNNYLLGKDPPALRHPRLERRQHEPAGRRCTASSSTSSRDNALVHAGADDGPRHAGRPQPDHRRHLRDRRDHRPPDAVAGLLSDHAAARRARARSCSATPVTSPAWSTRPATPRRITSPVPSRAAIPTSWLAAAERQPGTWWEHWADWVERRSGPERRRAEQARAAGASRRRARAGLLRPQSACQRCMSDDGAVWSPTPEPPRACQRHRATWAGWPTERGICASTATSSCGGGRWSDLGGLLGVGLGLLRGRSPRRPTRRRWPRPAMPGARWFEGAQLNYAEHVLARAHRAPGASIVHVGEDGVASELTIGRAARPGRSAGRRRCASWGSAPATVSPPTCRTSPRRSSRCWRRRASARSGRPARRTSERAACSTASPRSSPRC